MNEMKQGDYMIEGLGNDVLIVTAIITSLIPLLLYFCKRFVVYRIGILTQYAILHVYLIRKICVRRYILLPVMSCDHKVVGFLCCAFICRLLKLYFSG